MIISVLLYTSAYAQGRTHPLTSEQLGADRSGFGEYQAKPGDWRGEQYIDGYRGYRTEILFPQGRSDERYYINMFYPHQGKGVWWHRRDWIMALEYETRRDGRVNFEWALPLKRITQREVAAYPAILNGLGSLSKLLFFRGLEPAGPISREMRIKLRERVGFASYFDNQRTFAALVSWFNDKNGIAWNNQVFDYLRLPTIRRHEFTGLFNEGRYPITDMEKALCGWGGSAISTAPRRVSPTGRSSYLISRKWKGRIEFLPDKNVYLNKNEVNQHHKMLQQNERLTLKLDGDGWYVEVLQGDPKLPAIQVGRWTFNGSVLALFPNRPGMPPAPLPFTFADNLHSLVCTDLSDAPPGMRITYRR